MECRTTGLLHTETQTPAKSLSRMLAVRRALSLTGQLSVREASTFSLPRFNFSLCVPWGFWLWEMLFCELT